MSSLINNPNQIFLMKSWLSCPYPSPKAALRLFCFPYAGGSGTWIYRNWGKTLPNTVEVHSVELPGHGRRLTEKPVRQLDLIIATLAENILPLLDKPFACFGHSLGGLIAFELVQYLRQTKKIEPFHLWVSATRAPHLPHAKPPIHTLPDADFIAEIRRYNGTPAEILNNPEFMALLLPALRTDFALLETYRYRPRRLLSCPITAFWGEEDKTISQSAIAAWDQHTSGSFSLQSCPGNHFFIHESAVLSALQSYFLRFSDLA